MKTKLNGILTLFLALVVQIAIAQTVTGKVTDASGEPVLGATVLVKGSSNATTTDFDGNYSISAVATDILVYSFAGYTPQEVPVGDRNAINIVMEEALDAVVVVGYRSKVQKTTVEAVATVDIEQIEDRSNASALQNLQGLVPGLNIATGSGQPGVDSTIILRGYGSLTGNVEPLFIIDGIPVDEDNFRSINQNDIATYSVLKDAAATAIYGNRGANGVILITTKRGRQNQPLTIRYQSSFGFTDLQEPNINVMSTSQILQYQRLYNVGEGAGLTDAEIATRGQLNVNWLEAFYRTGTAQSHNLSISSGSENSSSFTSLGYFNQEGILQNSSIQRFNLRNNFNGNSVDKKFRYATNISLNYSETNAADGAGSGSTFFNPFTSALRALPYLPVSADGGITPGDIGAITANDAANQVYVNYNSLLMNIDQEQEVKILASVNGSYDLNDNLTVGIITGLDMSTQKRLETINPNSILGPFQVDGTNRPAFGGRQDEDYRREFRFNNQASLQYSNVFNEKHTVNAGAYVEYNKSHLYGFGFDQFGIDSRLYPDGSGFIDPSVQETIGGLLINPYLPSLSSFKIDEGLFSYFANADYDYDNKYGLSATVRRDASFRFQDDNQWGTFYSIGARWNIEEEDFMEDSVFNLLKLRASHGTSGNQRIVNGEFAGANLIRSLYGVGSQYDNTPGTVVNQIGVPDLRWELITQTNVGVDFGVWKNRLNGTLDVYRKSTSDLYQSAPVRQLMQLALSLKT
ncbi:TonB-dependent receptor [Nonlabens ulvanivorans]|nr:SusC/RagA family TonB-linked outer membrane protein [Nonlabens ulvanivorans]GAK89788.1 TonB-dependent receptor [Nonlabens ulvanivorans]